jgi:hypothetical protein
VHGPQRIAAERRVADWGPGHRCPAVR